VPVNPYLDDAQVTQCVSACHLLSLPQHLAFTMEDPLSSVHDRPHRYLLDSDSEDEEGQGLYAPSESGPSRLSKIKISNAPTAKVSITATGSYEEVVLGIGQAGKYISRKFGGAGDVEVKVGDEVVGKGGVVGGRLILGVDDESVEDLHALAGELLKVETKSWYVPIPPRRSWARY
jgi:hypothetical protein